MVDLDNAVNGMMGVATIGIVAGATERIINGRRRPVRRKKLIKYGSKRNNAKSNRKYWLKQLW